MTIVSRILGNAVSVDIDKIRERLDHLFLKDERIELVFKVVRDMLIITDNRVMFIHYYGVTGKKTKYKTIPHKSINYFTVETAGHIDFDFELKIWVKGRSEPISTKLKKNKELAYEVIRVLTKYTT